MLELSNNLSDSLKAESFMEVLVFHGRHCAGSYSAGPSRLVFQDQSGTEFDSISRYEPDRSGLVFQDHAFFGRAAVVVGGYALRILDDSFGRVSKNPDAPSAIGADSFLDHRRRLDCSCASVAVCPFLAGVGTWISNRPSDRSDGLSQGLVNEIGADRL